MGDRLDEAARGITAYVEARAEEQQRFLIDLCDQNSHTHHTAGVNLVAAMIIERLGGALPLHERIEQRELGDHHLLRNRAEGRAIYLIGHLDTVFPREHSFQRCRVDGERLSGPGTGDMKGGLAVFVYAIGALAAVGRLDRLSLALMLNSDEEAGSITSRVLFERERERAAACLCGECAGPDGEIVVARNGKLGARLDSFGTGRHIGRATHEKSSAILELAHRIVALEGLNAVFPGVSVNVGRVEGGLGPATVPDRASALIDVRWVEEAHRAALREAIEGVLAAPSQPGCRSEFEILNARPAWPRSEAGDRILAEVQGIGRRLGREIRPEHRRGTSDACFFGSHGVPTLDGFGPVCEGDHTPEEYILIPSLKERTILLALLLASRVGGANP